jgi:hypothetical protein
VPQGVEWWGRGRAPWPGCACAWWVVSVHAWRLLVACCPPAHTYKHLVLLPLCLAPFNPPAARWMQVGATNMNVEAMSQLVDAGVPLANNQVGATGGPAQR